MSQFQPYSILSSALCKFKLLVFGALALATSLRAQEVAIGVWQHHLPNRRIVSIAETPDKIFAATPYGIVEYDLKEESVRKIDKVQGLSDFGINVIRYHSGLGLLIIGYQNGTVDILKNHKVYSVPDIRQANILGSKAINDIFLDGNQAYLSCDFGVVILDLRQLVILDTWYIGPQGSMLNVLGLTKTATHWYAATEAGLLRAASNAPNLADFQYWNKESGLPSSAGKYTHVAAFQDKVIANFSGSISDVVYVLEDGSWRLFDPLGDGYGQRKRSIRVSHGKLLISAASRIDVFDQDLSLMNSITQYLGGTPNLWDAILDQNQVYRIGDDYHGLVSLLPDGSQQTTVLSGPLTANAFDVLVHGAYLWVAPGALTGNWQNTWNGDGMFLRRQSDWTWFNRFALPQMEDVRDIHQVSPDLRNPDKVYAASWSDGLLEFDGVQGLVNIYNHTNSSLERRSGVNDWVRVGGSAMDREGNLWVTNSEADRFLSVRKANGQWMGFNSNGLVANSQTVGGIVVDNNQQKWIVLPRNGGIVVFKERSLDNPNTFDIRKLTTQTGSGALPSNNVTHLAKDNDGYIWVGSDNGVVVFYTPQQALTAANYEAQPIIVVQDGFGARLFDKQRVNCITIDGANKKWFGTASSGAFLMSPDARETLLHFNTQNSPLPSNNILSIHIAPQTGEVFFATDRGLVSWRGFATQGTATHTEVLAFPNPVRPGYQGYIAVKGLVTNARVKITDINGNLVHDSFAEGGQLVWNGQDLHGRRPASGVYLVFSTNADGTETLVTKILFLN